MSTYSTHPAILKARQQATSSSKMSITQTFFLAHKARGKLSHEAAKSNHDLRLLVLHANFLDQLMLNLSQAEREEDAWFNNMVRGNSADDEAEHVHYSINNKQSSNFETIEEEPEIGWLAEDYSDSESDSSDDDSEDEFDNDDALEIKSTSDFTLFPASLSRKPSINQQLVLSTAVEVDPEYDSDSEKDDEDEDDGFYALERTSSHRPPSLVDDLSDSDEEDHNPPSPPQPTLAVPIISEKQRKQLVTTSFYDDSTDSLMDNELSSLITAY